MSMAREIDQLKRRANKVALQTNIPEIRIFVLREGDPDPEDFDGWSIVIRIESQRDYYPEAAPSTAE